MKLSCPDSSFKIEMNFHYRLAYTEKVFETSNRLLLELLGAARGNEEPVRALVFLDEGLSQAQPDLLGEVQSYFHSHRLEVHLVGPPVLVIAGERAKNQKQVFENILQTLHEAQLCRHSYVIAVGGGAVLDTVCFAASIVHRGLKQLRIPTTVLAQADAGIGVKNGINAYGKKNFLGTFSPPDGVINDFRFLVSLDQRNWISGIAEAIKVALVRDREFFLWILAHAFELRSRNLEAMRKLIGRCAELHLRQITQGGDPFEKGSARPLDFGHWIAHKLESLSDHHLTHGHAVALGMAVDSIYSFRKGILESSDLRMILDCLLKIGFELASPQLREKDVQTGKLKVLSGIDEFREHLGGRLSLTLLTGLGQSLEVHEIDEAVMVQSIEDCVRGETFKSLEPRQNLPG